MELTEGHRNQIYSLRKEGKRPKEIAGIIRTTYNIDLTTPQVYQVIYQAKRKEEKDNKEFGQLKEPIPNHLPKRKYKKKAKPVHIDATKDAASKESSIEQIVKDIVSDLSAIESLYKNIFLHLRLIVLKDKAKVLEIAKGAGIDMEGLKDDLS